MLLTDSTSEDQSDYRQEGLPTQLSQLKEALLALC